MPTVSVTVKGDEPQNRTIAGVGVRLEPGKWATVVVTGDELGVLREDPGLVVSVTEEAPPAGSKKALAAAAAAAVEKKPEEKPAAAKPSVAKPSAVKPAKPEA